MLIEMNRHVVAPNRAAVQTHKGMAHFAGTGPAGAKCGKCGFWGSSGRKSFCRKARQLGTFCETHIPAATAACKYFEVAS